MATDLRPVKLMMPPAQVETAKYLAELRGISRSAYLTRLVEEDADRCAGELRRLSWQLAREEDVDAPAEAPPQPPATGGQPRQGV